jgi:predicted esterase
MTMTRRVIAATTILVAAAGAASCAGTLDAEAEQESPPQRQDRRALFRTMLWGANEGAAAARAQWNELRATQGRGADDADTREDLFELEEVLREGPPLEGAVPGEAAERIDVRLADGRLLPVFVATPPGYSPERPSPVMFAMHGGPPGSAEAAVRSAVSMVNVWREAAAAAGWIMVSPAMVHVRSMGPRTDDRLPYEVLTPRQAETILAAVQRRYRVDPDRIVSTGISLGSNFSIGYAASIPHRFAAIVPVSTEGDSREHLLRNLQHVPVYVLEGTQDRNIRGINGPRALAEILAYYAYDATYREFSDRAHEGFSELYPDVLRWAEVRPRDPYPRHLLRLPHEGIMPLARRVFWIESDTRQGVVRVRAGDDNHIEIDSRWARRVTLFLNDRIVDLDRPIEITVNGERLAPRRARREVTTAVDQVRALDDRGRVASAIVTIDIPRSAEATAHGTAFWEGLAPVHPEGQLSFWELYAVNALAERFPSVGLEGHEVELDDDAQAALGAQAVAAESIGMALTSIATDGPFASADIEPGDVLIDVGGEPFLRGRGGLRRLHEWLMRELTATPQPYRVRVWRDGRLVESTVSLALGPYEQ